MKIFQRRKKPDSILIPCLSKTFYSHTVIKSPYKPRSRSRLNKTSKLVLSLIILYLLSYSTTLFTNVTVKIQETIKHNNPLLCRNFDHGDTSPLDPTVESIFNCNSPSGKCNWFFPAKFFDEYCGIGRDFAYFLTTMENKRLDTSLWREMPPIIVEWASITKDMPPAKPSMKKKAKKMKAPKTGRNATMITGLHAKPKVTTRRMKAESPKNASAKEKIKKLKSKPSNIGGVEKLAGVKMDTPLQQHNISMVHVHKNAGTSLVFAMGALHHSLSYHGDMMIVYPQVGASGQKPEQYKTKRERAGKHLDGAVKYKKEWGPTDHTIFAVVRDPAERFISAIGQAAGGRGSPKSTVSKQLLDDCIKDTPSLTLSCFVDLVKEKSTFLELHFTPMAYEISFSTMYKDIPVAVFPFEEVPSILKELGAPPSVKRKDGHKKGHRKDDMLVKMSVDDYDEKSIKTLCEIYRVDVLLMWHLGHKTRCDDYVQK